MCFFLMYHFLHRSLPASYPAAQSDLNNMSAERFRIFRAEKTYCVNAGKWYFELEVRGKMMILIDGILKFTVMIFYSKI